MSYWRGYGVEVVEKRREGDSERKMGFGFGSNRESVVGVVEDMSLGFG